MAALRKRCSRRVHEHDGKREIVMIGEAAVCGSSRRDHTANCWLVDLTHVFGIRIVSEFLKCDTLSFGDIRGFHNQFELRRSQHSQCLYSQYLADFKRSPFVHERSLIFRVRFMDEARNGRETQLSAFVVEVQAVPRATLAGHWCIAKVRCPEISHTNA